jgi:hypothetical protein
MHQFQSPAEVPRGSRRRFGLQVLPVARHPFSNPVCPGVAHETIPAKEPASCAFAQEPEQSFKPCRQLFFGVDQDLVETFNASIPVAGGSSPRESPTIWTASSPSSETPLFRTLHTPSPGASYWPSILRSRSCRLCSPCRLETTPLFQGIGSPNSSYSVAWSFLLVVNSPFKELYALFAVSSTRPPLPLRLLPPPPPAPGRACAASLRDPKTLDSVPF